MGTMPPPRQAVRVPGAIGRVKCALLGIVDHLAHGQACSIPSSGTHPSASLSERYVSAAQNHLVLAFEWILYRDEPDIVLLDIMMPMVSGLEILATVRSIESYAHLPVLILTGAESCELKREALELGATDFLAKPVDAEELIPRVRNALLIRSYQSGLQSQVRQRTSELEKTRRELVYCLARTAEYRDNETANHIIRVGCYAGIIAEELGLDQEQATMLRMAATLHDLGKVAIPDAILLKPGKLTDDEFRRMKSHAGLGREICHPNSLSLSELEALSSHTTVGASILSASTSPLMQMASKIALTHHEKWDGSGYPLGLAGKDIPIEGRITAVADVFDALNSKRPYKPAFPIEKCFVILQENRGTHFDPQVLDAFLARRDEIITVQITYADISQPGATAATI